MVVGDATPATVVVAASEELPPSSSSLPQAASASAAATAGINSLRTVVHLALSGGAALVTGGLGLVAQPSPATMLTPVATITTPKTYESSECISTVRRIRRSRSDVSETW